MLLHATRGLDCAGTQLPGAGQGPANRVPSLQTVAMATDGPPALPCPEPEPEPGGIGAATAALVEMAKAFAQPPPFSAFGGPPPVALAAGNPWDVGTGAAGTPQPQQISVRLPPLAASSAELGTGDDVATATRLPDALAEQFGAAVSDLLDEDDGSGEKPASGPVPWAVLPTTAECTGREASC